MKLIAISALAVAASAQFFFDGSAACAQISTPCDCTNECGWSTTSGSCVEATRSQTDCQECPSQPSCHTGPQNHAANVARMPQMMHTQPMHRQQFQQPRMPACGQFDDPCTCAFSGTGHCGWSTTTESCVSANQANTDCDECPDQDICYGDDYYYYEEEDSSMNSMLPLLLMGRGGGSSSSMLPMLMAQGGLGGGMGGGSASMLPLLMMSGSGGGLFGDDGEGSNNDLLTMMMMGGGHGF